MSHVQRDHLIAQAQILQVMIGDYKDANRDKLTEEEQAILTDARISAEGVEEFVEMVEATWELE
jgi:hypothetical protein